MKAVSRETELRSIVDSLGLDALVLMSPENFAYGSGLHIITVSMIRPRQAFLIVPKDRKIEMVLCSIELSQARQEGWVQDITTYTEFVDHPIDVLTKKLGEMGLASGKLGMDTDYLPYSSWERFNELLPQARMVNTTEAVAAVRAIKAPDEVAFMEAATRSTHQAVLDGMAASKLGDSEKEMCLKIATGVIANGADGTAFLCFTSGDRCNLTHGMATDRVPQEGEIIRFDLGGVYGLFSSDFARTYSAGNPTDLQKQTYTALVKSQKAVIDIVRPGLAAEDLYFATRDAFKTNGLDFRQAHIGHSFGIELHESPMLRPGEKTVLKPGMVLNIEPSCSDEHRNKYHTEDLLVVTDTGYHLMTLGTAPEELPVVGQKVA